MPFKVRRPSVRTGRFTPLLPEEGWPRFADGVVGGDWVPSLEITLLNACLYLKPIALLACRDPLPDRLGRIEKRIDETQRIQDFQPRYMVERETKAAFDDRLQ